MKYVFTLLALISLSMANAQEDKSQAILDKLSAKMKGYKSFYIEFTATIKNASNGTNQTETGKGYVKGDKFTATYGENTILSNGVKTWTIVKEEKTVYQTDAAADDEESINPKKLMTIWETGFKSKYEKEEKLNNEAVHVINLYPKNPSKVEYHTIILYVSKTTNELKKAVMKTKDGTSMTYTLTKFQGNPTVEDSMFVFDKKKYPGYTVIED
ncbi:MAG: LolA family protein [Bacteroidota bacterium]|jgi:outer membrane lipoprotein-sorting protein